MNIKHMMALVVVACITVAWAEGPAEEVQDRGWPRSFDTDEYNIIVHQPQVDQWPDFERITFRAAISIARKGEEDRTYGTIRVSAATQVAVPDRLVQISDRKIEQVTFPDVPAADAERLKAAIMAVSPADKAITVSLDRIIAQLDVSQVKVRKVNVSLAPPTIVYTDKPAIMVIFIGKPRFKPVTGSDLMFAINTNWDVFMDPGASRYYLLNGKSWLVTDDIEKGMWAATVTLPAALSRLPGDDNWNDVRAAIPPTPAAEVPQVLVSTAPAELVVTHGAPEFEPVKGTKLMLVANTQSDLFFYTTDKQYYLLASGRWFKAGALTGPWRPTSTMLPEDFRSIPEDSEAADVLASVPGTDAANEAIVLASIPQKATVNRTEVTVNVTYDGPPQFKPIETTMIQYAYNSPYSVLLFDGKYYCCYNAIWFVSSGPTGPWVVADMIPQAIYSIPPTSPVYSVTYVTVYSSTPTTVVTGYTAGYSGETVAATGAVMFGLGLAIGAAIADDDDYWHYHYPPYYFSYGCGARYHGAYGGYVAGGAVYGPYGGAGRYAAYNPSTGVYSRGAAVYGPGGAAGYRAAYNPSTGNAGYIAGGGNAYGSWGRGGVTNGDDWVRGGYKSGPAGSVGAIQGSGGGAAIHAEGKYNNGATVARGQDGDLYAGKDGNVYKKTEDGWQQQSALNSARPTQTARSPQAPASRPSAQPTSTRPSAASISATREAPQQAGNLQREATTRSRGESRATRTQQFQRNPAQSAPSGGGRSGGRRR